MLFPPAAVERAMTIREVVLRAMSGALTWIQAAEIIGCTPRTLRRWRQRFEQHGYDGLLDHRYGRPSPRRVSFAEVQRLLRLYRERYPGFNGRHFYHTAQREHGLTLSYSYVKTALQKAGLLPKARARGRHRRRREPRPCLGELLHLDGSRHRWLALVPDQWFTLIAIVDDATKRLLYAQLVDGGERCRGHHDGAAHRLRNLGPAHGPLHRSRPLGGPHPARRRPARSHAPHPGRPRPGTDSGSSTSFTTPPQARGRSERVNRTLQDRLVNGLRVGGITTLPAANRYLRDRFLPTYNTTFTRPPADPASAFVALGRTDLDQILCHEQERVVARDNTVVLERMVLAHCQAARPALLCGAAGARASPPRWPLLGLVQAAAASVGMTTKRAGRRLTVLSLKADRSRVKTERTDHLPSTAPPSPCWRRWTHATMR